MIQNYTLTLSLVKKKNNEHCKDIDLQSQAIYEDKKNSKKNLHMLERRWMWCASRWCWTSNCLKFVYCTRKVHSIDDFLQNFVMMPWSVQWFRWIWKYLKLNKSQIQNIEDHEIYIQNWIQPFAFEHHF